MNRKRERAKSTNRSAESNQNNLSIFNSMKATSLLSKKVEQSQKELFEKLKAAMINNQACEV